LSFLWRHRGGLSLKFWHLEEVAQRAKFFTLPSIHLTRRNARKRQSLFDREGGFEEDFDCVRDVKPEKSTKVCGRDLGQLE
jgi:hypothetical protein